MGKKNLSIFLNILILAIIILLILFLVVESLFPIASNIIESYKAESNKKHTINTSDFYKTEISYEDKLLLMQMVPDLNYKGRIYHNIYGKKVYEDEEVLDLSDVEIDENIIGKMILLPNLKEVNLYNKNLSNDDKLLLRESFPNVLFKWNITIIDENVDYNVETLDLSNKKVTDIDDLRKSLQLLSNLKKVDFSHTNLSNEQLGSLREEFPNIRIDWVVHLGKWSLRTDSVAFSVLVYQYDYRRMTSKDIEVLKYCTELQALDLGHQAIEDISVIGEYLPNLRVLILADNKIKDISPLANLKHLHYLELFMNDITDVTPLAECKEMVDLNISFNYRFSNIDGILNFPLLERLWLISDRISSDSYKTIRETYPNVKLVTTGSGSTNSGWRTHERYFAMIDMYRKNYISESFTKFDNAIKDNN